MSTQFKPLEIPPGVVSTATKKMRSSNWSEVNLIRWREGQLMPMGGQLQLDYTFASRCKVIHGWYGLDGVYHIAYLCEQHLYVDTGGELEDITPVDGIVAPTGLAGGFGDGIYDEGLYGTPRDLPGSVSITKVPDFYSLDNFGNTLFAMTSSDQRLLMWDPAVGGPAILQTADSGRGVVPNGRCFVVTQERFIVIFGSINDGTDRRQRGRQRAAVRVVRPGEPWRMGLHQRRLPGRLPRHRAGEPDPRALSPRAPASFSGPPRKPTPHASLDCHMSTITLSCATAPRPGRRSRSAQRRR